MEVSAPNFAFLTKISRQE